MPSDKVVATESQSRVAVAPEFTLERANSSLVLVRRVVETVVRRYDELMQLRREREQYPADADRQERVQELDDHIGRCVEQLNDLNRELMAIGCVLKDWRTGLVDFPAVHRGRRVWLCWRLGEPAVAHWHDPHAGFSGRVPTGRDFE